MKYFAYGSNMLTKTAYEADILCETVENHLCSKISVTIPQEEH